MCEQFDALFLLECLCLELGDHFALGDCRVNYVFLDVDFEVLELVQRFLCDFDKANNIFAFAAVVYVKLTKDDDELRVVGARSLEDSHGAWAVDELALEGLEEIHYLILRFFLTT